MSKIARRDFIKISGAGLGAAVVGSGLVTKFWGLDADPIPDPHTDGDRVVPSYCELCFWKCGILAHVKGDRITKIVGNPEHPLSRGHLCPRGTGGLGLIYDPDRLRRPLVRREKRGSQVFEPVSWDAALDEVAEKLTAIKQKYGPEALALYSHGTGGSWFKPLVNAFGSNNIAAPGEAQCRAPRDLAFGLTIGYPVGSPEMTDMANSRVITLIGSHIGENMHNTQVQDLATAISRGAELVVVDPRFSTAAGKARYWLPIKPGTDTALLLAWMHVIIKEKLYDHDYVDQYTTGFAELATHVADKTPEWAFTHTTIEPHIIRETARLIAGAHPHSLVHPGRHVVWYGNDTQRERAIAILNGLLGAYGRRGGLALPDNAKVPGYPLPAFDHKPRPPADRPKGKIIPFAESVISNGIRDASIPGTADYDIKAWLVYGTNLLQSLPQPEKTKEAIRNLDFIAAIDVLPMEITGWADVVLPEAVYLERYDDLNNPPYQTPFVSLRQPVVPPLGDSKPGWWIARELGKRLGLEKYFPWKDAEDYLGTRLAAGGYDFAELKQHGVIKPKAGPSFIEDGLVPTFPTRSQKIEFYSHELEEAGLHPIPEYEPTPQPDTAAGEFRLLFGRTPVHTFGRTTNNRFLSQIKDTNVVWVNKKIATERGLECGDWVELVNQDGARSQPIQVRATQRIRPDCVFMVHGYGHTDKGLHFAYGRGANDTQLITRIAADPANGSTGMNVNFVRIEKVAGPDPDQKVSA